MATDGSALRAFLEARLDEDERAANKAARFRYDHPLDAPWERARLAVERRTAASSDPHIARQNPARALREVVAKRAILTSHRLALDVPVAGESSRWAHDGAAAAFEDTLRALASVWSDHPDYRPEWSTT